jgi:transketolase
MQPFIIEQSLIKQLSTESDLDLQKRAHAYRINCLAGLMSARHGWLGASFSSMELLTCIYHRFIVDPTKTITQRASLHISKGHAAMAQYAVLSALGCFESAKLLTYKQFGGLPAHCDRKVPGVDSDSGSLGQGLSKAIGTAISNQAAGRRFPVFALIGDGELQEGQVFEALLSLKKLRPWGCIPIIDRNFLQSDSQTAEIKDADDWAVVFKGIGLSVIEINGHNIGEIHQAIDRLLDGNEPGIIIAHTIKGSGSSKTAMPNDTQRRKGVWHGKIPDAVEYREIVEELLKQIDKPALNNAWVEHKRLPEAAQTTDSAVCPENNIRVSTGAAFTQALLELAGNDSDVYVLDADLEKSCQLTEIATAFGNRYLEIGISEQDMCSIAAGLALTGRIAVVNTYAAFFKRSLDQVFSCITEKVPVIFAGHYAGIDYFTDGKSHQALNDIGLMRSLGNIEIYEPIDADNTREVLCHVIELMKHEIRENGCCRPAYIRLHRTPGDNFYADPFVADEPVIFTSGSEIIAENLLFTSGPHMLEVACSASEILAEEGIPLDLAAVVHFSDEKKQLKDLLGAAKRVFVLEDHRRETGLGSFISGIGKISPVSIGVRDYTQSSLSLQEMLAHHQLDAETVCAVVRKVASCSHHQ